MKQSHFKLKLSAQLLLGGILGYYCLYTNTDHHLRWSYRCVPTCSNPNEPGRFINDTYVPHLHCHYPWLSRQTLRKRLSGHWLVFIGDSDTRGLVLAMLQMLDRAQVGAFSGRKWWNTTSGQPSMIGRLDWIFRDSSTQKKTLPKIGDETCDLRYIPLSSLDVRVTYCFTGSLRHFYNSTDYSGLMSKHLSPDAIYLNTGAHDSADIDLELIRLLLLRVVEANPNSTIIWGTALSFRRDIVDAYIVPRLHNVRILNRSMVSESLISTKRVVLSDKHAPHMINGYDVFRLASMLAPGYCAPRYELTFSDACKRGQNSSSYVDAWQNRCSITVSTKGFKLLKP